MTANEQKTIKLDISIYKQLKELKHPGQSFNGVLQELINGTKKK